MGKYTYESIGEVLEENTLTVLVDSDCDMAIISLNDICIMEGNDWDFHNGCNGMYDMPEFNNIEELKNIIIQYIESLGKQVTYTTGTYSYE